MTMPDRIWAVDDTDYSNADIFGGTPYLALHGPTLTELVASASALVDEYCDYMRINNLGDPEKQHNIKRVRAALRMLEGSDG